jgi:hypothetical protein
MRVFLSDIVKDLQKIIDTKGDQEVIWLSGYLDAGESFGVHKTVTITTTDENEKLDFHKLTYTPGEPDVPCKKD